MLRYLMYMHFAVANALRDRLDDRGATAVEYGLIVTLIAVAIITIVGLVGGRLNNIFTTVYNAL
jgi:pilus assembly protein Flp/PilA